MRIVEASVDVYIEDAKLKPLDEIIRAFRRSDIFILKALCEKYVRHSENGDIITNIPVDIMHPAQHSGYLLRSPDMLFEAHIIEHDNELYRGVICTLREEDSDGRIPLAKDAIARLYGG